MSASESATTFAIVGSGRRSRFLLHLARAAPGRLRVSGVITRTAESGRQVSEAWGVPAYRTTEELLRAERPQFVVAAVPWAQMPVTVRELVTAKVRVLAETPPAPDLDGLRSLWVEVGATGRVQVAEQYLLMPGHAAQSLRQDLATTRVDVQGGLDLAKPFGKDFA